ncbi:MAG: tetratricopeptide repeat protein [Deltaproteobacteria bacterium]|nr:tetratricopeptide repeat protein [Deltaproteobacteria bacterium]
MSSFAHADDKADKAEAAKHYQLGKRHYNLNEWDEAIAEFKTAYKLSPDPVNLYNIAQAYRLKKNCTTAAQFYANYQREEKIKRLRDSVTKVRKDMEKCAETEKPEKSDEPLPIPPLDPVVPTTNAPPVRPAPINPGSPPVATTGENALRTSEPANLDPNRNRRILSYVLIGVGSLSLLTGVSLSFKAADFDGQLDDCRTFDDCGVIEERKLQEDADSARRGAGGAYGFGGVCVLGGVILYMVSRKPKADRPHNVTVMPSRGGAAMSWTF